MWGGDQLRTWRILCVMTAMPSTQERNSCQILSRQSSDKNVSQHLLLRPPLLWACTPAPAQRAWWPPSRAMLSAACVFIETPLWKQPPRSLRRKLTMSSHLSASSRVAPAAFPPHDRPQTPDTGLAATRHVCIISDIVSLTLFLAVRGARRQALLSPLLLSPLYLRAVPSGAEPPALVSSASLTGPLLSSPTTSLSHTQHRQAGARSGAPGRAHALCAHCSAAADVWWPQGRKHCSKLLSKYIR